MRLVIAPFYALAALSSAFASAATIHAKPGDDLQTLVNQMQKGDELLLADGVYEKACIDFGVKNGIAVRAEKLVPVKIEIVQNEPTARGGAVILHGAGKPFVLARGSNVTIRGVTIDGCSNAPQSGAIQCGSGWTVEDVIVQHVDTAGAQVAGSEQRRVHDITLTRVVTQDNGYIGMGGSFADHVRLSGCASFRNNRGWDRNAFAEHGYQKDGKWFCHAQWEGGGGKFAACSDVQVERHWAQGNNGPGMWFDWINKNIVVRDSMFIDQTWTEFDYDALGLQLEINDGPTLIENCLFQGNVCGLLIAEDHGATVRKCHIVDGIWTRNITEGTGLRNAGVQDVSITDNIFYGTAKISLWKGMDDAYLKQNRITLGPNTMNSTPPVTWHVEGWPTPAMSAGMPAPIHIFDRVDLGLAVSNGWGPVEVDTSVGEKLPRDGLALSIAGQKFDRGLGVHAPFAATYLLSGEPGIFRTKVGIDDEVGASGTATLRVLLDDQEVLAIAVRGAQPAKDVQVDVTGKKKMTLFVDDAGDGFSDDHVDLIEPRIEQPAPSPAKS